MLRRILRDTSGVTVAEAAFILPVLLVMTFGLMEFAIVFYQYNAAEKATQDGARTAAVAMLPPTVATWSCTSDPAAIVGDRCPALAANTAPTVITSCTGDGCSTLPGWAAVIGAMQAALPDITPANVVITYSDAGLGFVGRPTPVPLITVQLTGMTYDFAVLDSLIGVGTLTMPDFRATVTGEAMGWTAP